MTLLVYLIGLRGSKENALLACKKVWTVSLQAACKGHLDVASDCHAGAHCRLQLASVGMIEELLEAKKASVAGDTGNINTVMM